MAIFYKGIKEEYETNWKQKSHFSLSSREIKLWGVPPGFIGRGGERVVVVGKVAGESVFTRSYCLIFPSLWKILNLGRIKRNRGRKTGLQLFQLGPHIQPSTSLIAWIWEVRRNRSHKMGQVLPFIARLCGWRVVDSRGGVACRARVKITLSIQPEGQQCLKLVPFQTCSMPSGWQWSEADAGTRRAGASGGAQVTFFLTFFLGASTKSDKWLWI